MTAANDILSDANYGKTMAMIRFTHQLNQEMSAHGEREYPNECCGLLIGRFSDGGKKTAVKILPLSNARESDAKHHRFLIPPQELLRGESYAAANGLDVIGFYHSHPDHPAIPSQYDLEHAWPVYSYIVIAVSGGRTGDLRSWELQPDRSAFNEEEISKGN